MKQSQFELSIDTQILTERLLKAEIGEVLTYAGLSGILGRDVQHEARYVLQSAIRRAEREGEIVFGTVHGTGIKRLADREIIGVGDRAIAHARRTVGRAIGRLERVRDFEALTPEERTRHHARRTVLGVIQSMTSSSAAKRIEAKVSETTQALPFAKTLALFRSDKGEGA